MNNFLTYLKNWGTYIISHKWSKDILRANLLYILLVIIYNIIQLAFPWRVIKWGSFWLFFLLLNLCLFFKVILDIVDRVRRR